MSESSVRFVVARPVSSLMRCLMSRERAVARERVRDGLAGPMPALDDAPAEEVEPVVDVGDRCLLGRERQPHLLCHELGRLLLDRLGLGAGARTSTTR